MLQSVNLEMHMVVFNAKMIIILTKIVNALHFNLGV